MWLHFYSLFELGITCDRMLPDTALQVGVNYLGISD